MKTSLIIGTAFALTLAAPPASAQLLGGGIGGALGGSIGGTIGGMGDSVTRTTGTLRGASTIYADRTIDRRSGKAAARADARNRSSGTAASRNQAIGRTIDTTIGGTVTGSGSAGADADLIGTDDVAGIAGGAQQRLGETADIAQTAVAPRNNGTGSTARAGNGSAAVNGSGSVGSLALAGTAAAGGAGNFAVAPGMIVEDARGRAIGSVRAVQASANGMIEQVLVTVGEQTMALPAANFSGSGEILVSAMSREAVQKTADDAAAN